MNQDVSSVSISQLKQLYPLDMVSDENLEKLKSKSVVVNFSKGDWLFKKQRATNLCYYLLKGKVDIRESHVGLKQLEAGPEARHPIDEQLSPTASVRAMSDVTVLHLNRDLIELILSWSLKQDTTTITAEGEDETDWMDHFLNSALIANLSASGIHQLLSSIETIEAQEGDVIVKSGETGEYFYVLQEGIAKGYIIPKEDAEFTLKPGDYFGEESLVSDAVRSATIKMVSPGVLGRINREEFNHLIKSTLIQYTTEQMVQEAVLDAQYYQFVDVRLPIEYSHGHWEASINIPIGVMRNKLDQLNEDVIYLVTQEGGRRSELATYMLRQHGLEAYLLHDTYENISRQGLLLTPPQVLASAKNQ